MNCNCLTYGLCILVTICILNPISYSKITSEENETGNVENKLLSQSHIFYDEDIPYIRGLNHQQYEPLNVQINRENTHDIIPDIDYDISFLLEMNATAPQDIIYVPDDYPTIQEAADNANHGDEIIVRNGIYVENIVIDKQLTVRSENGFNHCTVRNDIDDAIIFDIYHDNVIICGFDIEGKEFSPGDYGIRLNSVDECGIYFNEFHLLTYCVKLEFSHDNIISDNIVGRYFDAQDYGVRLLDSNYNIIVNNTINHLHGNGQGIRFENSNHNLIRDNNFFSNNYGMVIEADSNFNRIINNTVHENNNGGINVYYSDNNIIRDNRVDTQHRDDIYLAYANENEVTNNTLFGNGFFTLESFHNTVENNTVHGKVLLYFEESSDIVIDYTVGQIILVNCNNITIYNQYFANVIVGVEFFNTDDSFLSDSVFEECQFEAIWMAYSDNNHIYNNEINENYYGLEMYFSEENDIFSNTFYHNDYVGMYIFSSNNNIFYENNLSRNRLYSIKLEESHYNLIYENLISDSFDAAGVEIWESGHNQIFDNCMKNNDNGVRQRYYSGSESNVIRNNLFIDNEVGIALKGGTGHCYHNTFIRNLISAKDDTNTQWDNGYPSGGNYWDDYEGVDDNGDGLGDSPYHISDGTSKDNYPLMIPSVEGNFPPRNPNIDGRVIGRRGKEYEYTLFTIEPENEDVYFYVDWGDETNTGWFGPYSSGEEIVISHTWYDSNIYSVNAKSKDIHDNESGWRNLEVAIPINQPVQFPIIQWLLERFPNMFPILRNLLEAQY